MTKIKEEDILNYFFDGYYMCGEDEKFTDYNMVIPIGEATDETREKFEKIKQSILDNQEIVERLKSKINSRKFLISTKVQNQLINEAFISELESILENKK